jgi:DNA-binding response OmpR family regulator
MQGMEILLVEDNAGDAVLIRQILADASVPVNLHIARDGEQALSMLSDSHFQPALIILDLNIPRITGRRSWSNGNRRKPRWLSSARLSVRPSGRECWRWGRESLFRSRPT